MQFDDKAAKAHRPGPFLAPLRHRRANGDNVETRQSGNLLDRSLLLARFQVVPVKLVASLLAAQPLAQPHATGGRGGVQRAAPTAQEPGQGLG